MGPQPRSYVWIVCLRTHTIQLSSFSYYNRFLFVIYSSSFSRYIFSQCLDPFTHSPPSFDSLQSTCSTFCFFLEHVTFFLLFSFHTIGNNFICFLLSVIIFFSLYFLIISPILLLACVLHIFNCSVIPLSSVILSIFYVCYVIAL